MKSLELNKKSDFLTGSALLVLSLVLIGLLAGLPTLAAPDCPTSMMSYWKFDEGSETRATDWIGGNPGTTDGAAWTEGILGNALSFDGVDDYVEVDDARELGGMSELSICAWIKIASDHRGLIVYKGTGAKAVYVLENYYGKVYIGLRNEQDQWQEIDTVTRLNSGTWYFVCGTYDGAYLKTYANGTLEKSLEHTGEVSSYNSNLFIGASWLFKFNGTIDEVAVYNKALSAQEIQRQYENALGGLDYCNELGATPEPTPPPSPGSFGERVANLEAWRIVVDAWYGLWDNIVQMLSAWYDEWHEKIEAVVNWQPGAEQRITALEEQVKYITVYAELKENKAKTWIEKNFTIVEADYLKWLAAKPQKQAYSENSFASYLEHLLKNQNIKNIKVLWWERGLKGELIQ